MCIVICLKIHQNAFGGGLRPDQLRKFTASPGALAGLRRRTKRGGDEKGE